MGMEKYILTNILISENKKMTMQVVSHVSDEFDPPIKIKTKKKRKQKDVSKLAPTKKSRKDDEWVEANIDTDNLLASSTVDGFLGLEELTDYTEDGLKELLGVNEDGAEDLPP